MQYIDKDALVAELERRVTEGEKVAKEIPSSAIMGLIQAYKNTLSFLDTIDVKEDEEMATSGECVTISKERYQELLEYESVALWAFNVIIVASLPSIEDEKLKEISDDVKCKAIQAAFQEALKNKEGKE